MKVFELVVEIVPSEACRLAPFWPAFDPVDDRSSELGPDLRVVAVPASIKALSALEEERGARRTTPLGAVQFTERETYLGQEVSRRQSRKALDPAR